MQRELKRNEGQVNMSLKLNSDSVRMMNEEDSVDNYPGRSD